MTKKHRFLLAVAAILGALVVQWCRYNLPVKLPLLDEVNESCYVKVLPIYKGLEQDDQLKTLSAEEILELKEFLQSGTYHRQKEGIRTDSDTTYRIIITWSDGKSVQIRTFGEDIYDGDTLAWDSKNLLILQSENENWHKELEKILFE